MPEFTYTGDDARYYPSLGVSVEPGQTVALEMAPADGRWSSGGVPVTPSPDPAADAVTPTP